MFSIRTLSLTGIKLASPRGSLNGFLVETLSIPGISDNFKHTFGVDRFRTSGIDYPAFPHRLEQGTQVMLGCRAKRTFVLKSMKIMDTG